MPWFRCPKCTKLFEGGPFKNQVCPACGYAGEAKGDAEAPAIPDGVVGRPRRFPPILAWTILTLGIYLLVYYYQAFREADRQHGREHPAEMFWIGLIPVIGLGFQAAYIVVELTRLRAYRRAHGLRPGFGPTAWFLTFLLVGGGLVAGGVLFLHYLDRQDLVVLGSPEVLLAYYVAFVLPGLIIGGLAATFGANRSLRTLWHVVYEEKGEALPEWMNDVDVSLERSNV